LYAREGYSIKIDSTFPRSGKRCAKFTLDGTDVYVSPAGGRESARAEMELFGVAPDRSEFYYGWSIRIPEEYEESGDWQVIGQFHDQPDAAAGETWETYPPHPPPIAFNYKNSKITLVANTPGEKSMVLAEREIQKGVWHDVVLRAYWSTQADGFVEAWIDGVPLSNEGMTRRYGPTLNNAAGNFLRIGLYRSMEIKTSNAVYYDEIRIGKTHESVLPA
jgi:hypothetical protein